MAEERLGKLARATKKRPLFRYQKIMMDVVVAALPAIGASVYFFGWRALAMVGFCSALGAFTEWIFTRSRGEPISWAVFVTAVLFALTLPPNLPFWIAAVGIVFAVMFGKEFFGGFGRNVFNPALVGRCFIYISFPVEMTNKFMRPFGSFPGGLVHWATRQIDSVGQATPMFLWRFKSEATPISDLFLGGVAGSLGETAKFLIILGGVYLLVRKTASWRIIVSTLLGGAAFSAILHYAGVKVVSAPEMSLLAGGFLFGAFFMATDPISAPRLKPTMWVYGFGIGALTIAIRAWSNFSGGMMFAILLMNVFNPILDVAFKKRVEEKKQV